jgi:hypothetical protein
MTLGSFCCHREDSDRQFEDAMSVPQYVVSSSKKKKRKTPIKRQPSSTSDGRMADQRERM